MTDAEPATIKLQGEMLRRERYTPWWAPGCRQFEKLVDMLPTYRNTQRGRRSAQQVRLLILVIGLVTLIFGGEWYFIVSGLLMMTAALIIPVSELRRRTWKVRLKELRTKRIQEKKSRVEIHFDGRYVTVLRDDERVRRVRVDKNRHRMNIGHLARGSCLALKPSSGQKSESIWLCTTSREWLPEESEEFLTGDVDMVVEVSADQLRELYEALDKNSK